MTERKRSGTKASAIRLIHTILAVPTGKWVSTTEVCDHLKALGYHVHRYTVARDLLTCCREFNIERRASGYGSEHQWRRNRGLE